MKIKIKRNNPIIKIVNRSLVDLPTPTSINYWWNFGSMLGICLVSQITTGIVLATQYNSNLNTAFESVIHISRDTNLGWLFRFLHLNLASLFFFLIYLHMFRGVFNNSPKTKKLVWRTGIVILVLLIAAAFLGYVLPWGQISFWGATVITNIFSAIPYLGKTLVSWLWGGFSVSQPTLTRFFALHFLIPIILRIIVLIHLVILHQTGSSNPIGTATNLDKVEFHPYFSTKDFTPFLVVIIIIIVLTTQRPLLLGDAENSNEANPLATPIHIQPEWYFLFAYAILRSIPSKLGGVVALLASVIRFLIPMRRKTKKNPKKMNPIKMLITWVLVRTLLILTWIGANPVEPPYELTGQITRILFFSAISFTAMP
jgi:ubiquinol-cytochrome c reductase cytochrome b subunit